MQPTSSVASQREDTRMTSPSRQSAGATAAPSSKPATSSAPATSSTLTSHKTACILCSLNCGIEVDVEADRLGGA